MDPSSDGVIGRKSSFSSKSFIGPVHVDEMIGALFIPRFINCDKFCLYLSVPPLKSIND